MLRIDMEVLGFKSINKYAIGENDNSSKYTNCIPFFSLITNARKHTEISSIYVKCINENDEPANENFEDLYDRIKRINGVRK